MHRSSASILNGRKLGADGQWATTVVWGSNAHAGGHRTNAALLESEMILDRSNTFFGRAEIAQKSAEELVLPSSFDPERMFNVGHISLGYIRELGRVRGTTIGIGVRGTVNAVPSALEPFYGSRTPTGALVFVRLRPWHEAAMSSMPGMQHASTRSRPMILQPIDVVVYAWLAIAVLSALYVAYDQFRHNPEAPVMKWGFVLVTLYMGPIGLLLYVFADKEPAPGTHERFVRRLWKQGVGSTVHCVAGDATGIIVAAVASLRCSAFRCGWT